MAIVPATRVEATGDGITSLFGFGFPYEQQADVHVTVDGVVTAFSFSAPNIVSILPAPANLSKVVVYRETPALNMHYIFTSGVPFLTKFADTNWRQLLYVFQEFVNENILNKFDLTKTLRTLDVLNILPDAGTRANKIVGFDATGQPIVLSYTSTSVPGMDARLILVENSVAILNAGRLATIPTFNGLAIVPAVLGQTVFTRCHTSGTIGGGQFIAVAGSVTNDGGTQINSATAGIYWKRIISTRVSTEMFGVVHGSDDTAAIQLALNSGYPYIYHKGASFATALTLPSNCTLYGDGKSSSISRKTNSSTGALISINGTNSFIREMQIDGNKANQINGGINVLIGSGASNYGVTDSYLINAKAVSGYGDGLQIVDASNKSAIMPGDFSGTKCIGNDGNGFNVNKEFYLSFNECFASLNGLAGFSFSNLSNPPPGSPTEQKLSMVNCKSIQNAYGLSISGYIQSYNGALQVSGSGKETASYITINSCHFIANTLYGLINQSKNITVSNCIVAGNGNSTSNGGALLNGSECIYSNNVFDSNYFYGADSAGATNSKWIGNKFSFNGLNSGGGGGGLNISAGVNNSVTGNEFLQNGDSTGGYGVQINGYDGGTDPVFPTSLQKTFIKDNEFNLANTLQYGVVGGKGDIKDVVLKNNDAYGTGSATRAFSIAAQQLIASGNNFWNGSETEFSVAASTTIVIPDYLDLLSITGSGSVTTIKTDSENTFFQKVRCVAITNPGSGYTAGGTFAAIFTGGGGSGAAGTVLIRNDGTIGAVNITNGGSGYTSNPTISFANGTGTGAAGTAKVGVNNKEKKEVIVYCANGVTLTSSTGNLLLSGGNFVADGVKYITLIGRFGSWYEKGRS